MLGLGNHKSYKIVWHFSSLKMTYWGGKKKENEDIKSTVKIVATYPSSRWDAGPQAFFTDSVPQTVKAECHCCTFSQRAQRTHGWNVGEMRAGRCHGEWVLGCKTGGKRRGREAQTAQQ